MGNKNLRGTRICVAPPILRRESHPGEGDAAAQKRGIEGTATVMPRATFDRCDQLASSDAPDAPRIDLQMPRLARCDRRSAVA